VQYVQTFCVTEDARNMRTYVCLLTVLDQSLLKEDGLNAPRVKQSISLYAYEKGGTNLTV